MFLWLLLSSFCVLAAHAVLLEGPVSSGCTSTVGSELDLQGCLVQWFTEVFFSVILMLWLISDCGS